MESREFEQTAEEGPQNSQPKAGVVGLMKPDLVPLAIEIADP